jgi:hypothetical protein
MVTTGCDWQIARAKQWENRAGKRRGRTIRERRYVRDPILALHSQRLFPRMWQE